MHKVKRFQPKHNLCHIRLSGYFNIFCIKNYVGAFHNLALKEDGRLLAWGNNEYGQLGTGDTQPTPHPVLVEGLDDLTLVDIAAGGWHSTTLTDKGEVLEQNSSDYDYLCDQFDRGDHGRLGYRRKVTTGQPLELRIKISPPEGNFNHTEEEEEGKWLAESIACGGRHTLAIVEWRSDDT